MEIKLHSKNSMTNPDQFQSSIKIELYINLTFIILHFSVLWNRKVNQLHSNFRLSWKAPTKQVFIARQTNRGLINFLLKL